MSFDLYADMHGVEPDTPSRIRLLAGTEGIQAISEYKQLVHPHRGRYDTYIKENRARMQKIDLLVPSPNLAVLPVGSWFIQFTFVAAKPWMSKDDDPLYVAESVNPVRKDKVFRVPMMAASSWKGLLRWTVMKVDLIDNEDRQTDDQFAERRLAHSLIFGDEKGEEPGEAKDFAAFLDGLKPGAKDIYRQKARRHFNVAGNKDMPHHRGRLNFYPTFFDAIDLEVINPHSRKTRAGTQPIYLECVPAGANGTLSLLHVPFDLIGHASTDVIRQAKEDLQLVAEGIQALMLTYGFSAKRTSGFGAAEDRVERGGLSTRAGHRTVTALSKLAREAANVEF
jgi:CRISPR-associated protein Cmr2